jgi:hypothetical protein
MARIPLTSSSNAVAMRHSANPSSSQSGLSSPTSMLLRHPPLSPCALSFPARQMGQRSLLSGTGPLGHHSFVMLPTFGTTRIKNGSTKLLGSKLLGPLVLLPLPWDPAMQSRDEPLITHPTPKLHPLTFRATSILGRW